MPKAMIAGLVVIVGALVGIATSTLLYLIVIGLHSLVLESGGGSEAGSLWRRSAQFGVTFGLLSGARLGLAGLYRWVGEGWEAPVVFGRAITVVLAAAALYLVRTGGRWEAMFGNLGGIEIVLVIAWLAVSYLLAKVIGTGR